MKAVRMLQFTDHPETLQKSRESIRKLNENPEYRQIISEARRKYYETHSPHTSPQPVLCVETGVVYHSMSQAEQATGANHGTIGLTCRKKRHTAGGLHWEYWKEEQDCI